METATASCPEPDESNLCPPYLFQAVLWLRQLVAGLSTAEGQVKS